MKDIIPKKPKDDYMGDEYAGKDAGEDDGKLSYIFSFLLIIKLIDNYSTFNSYHFNHLILNINKQNLPLQTATYATILTQTF